MTIFEYKCPVCDTHGLSHLGPADRMNFKCPTCEQTREFKRVFSIAFHRPLQEHFNATLNRPVTSNHDFDEGLKRAEEEAYLNDGFDHKFERIDPEDTKSLGVTAEGLESTNRVRVSKGLKPIDLDRL